ncbi:peptidase M10 [Haoranjiania flava]|uniref:Peptidase M10 n=1 Tax=Haoranjiania flava TaxID=1856322 RepID=A0AAE3LK45_9BACT|nr:peptidase M10 [Haoranjiania flava]MCU7694019.1 peptidase M10 [Haoranjiania flava]
MVSVEIFSPDLLLLKAHIITYGNAATPALTEMIRSEIATMWNEPQGRVSFKGRAWNVRFEISAELKPHLAPEDIYFNTDPCNNYFRIEDHAMGNISFVDDLGSNTGYFLTENLYAGSTTAAHEFGHTLGLKHPSDLDLRGLGVPGIMYPRGTLTDPQYQYDPSVPPGEKGGTMHPIYRKVTPEDIAMLRIDALVNEADKYVIGNFTSLWHEPHSTDMA